MPNRMHYTPQIGDWFRAHREGYEWPIGRGQQASEDDISNLLHKVQVAITTRDPHRLKEAMVKVHYWKTRNRGNQTCKYKNALTSKPANYVRDLLNMAPFTGTANVQGVIDHLKIPGCNLPVCSAIASFLYGRSSVTVIDKFLSMFFKKCFRKTPEIGTILNYVSYIDFKLESSGARKRLAVYSQRNYEHNRDKYVTDFLRECSDIANDLNSRGVTFCDGSGLEHQFAPIDVEMAIFAWCSKNKDLFP